MASTDWIHELKVADLKEELKKRGQPVAGKKAELAARLEEYVKEHEAGSAEAEPAAGAEEATKEAEPAAEEATVAAAEPELPAAAETAAAPVEEAKASPADDIDLDYGESEDEQPQQHETKPVEKAATAPSQNPDEKEKKAEPESRKRPNASTEPTTEEASRPEKQAKTEAAQPFSKKQDQPESENGAEPTATAADKPQGSRALRIEGFVRPFTENQARTLLDQSGTITAMWMPSIRNVAWVVYSTKSEAETAKTALFKLQWPAGSPKVLMPASVSVHAAEKAIRIGSNNPEFKIERTEEDGPDEPEGMDDVVGGHPSRQQQHAADDDILKDASPLRVKDLRELLSRKSTGGSGTGERKRRDPVPNLDELFRKTTAKPAIYWLPLSEEAVELKKKAKAAIAGAGGRGGRGRNGGRGGR
jgi:apoptotic chromatin condensation inducer in the nucleus